MTSDMVYDVASGIARVVVVRLKDIVALTLRESLSDCMTPSL